MHALLELVGGLVSAPSRWLIDTMDHADDLWGDDWPEVDSLLSDDPCP